VEGPTMSHVDNWMILSNSSMQETDEEEMLPRQMISLNDSLTERFSGYVCFERVDQLAGGTKAIEADVFMLATNNLDSDEVLSIIRSNDWDGCTVQVLFLGQRDTQWRFL
jgi:hypothetical protein